METENVVEMDLKLLEVMRTMQAFSISSTPQEIDEDMNNWK